MFYPKEYDLCYQDEILSTFTCEVLPPLNYYKIYSVQFGNNTSKFPFLLKQEQTLARFESWLNLRLFSRSHVGNSTVFGLSLGDNFWIKLSTCSAIWDEVNLYDNFYSSSLCDKFWDKDDGIITLFKIGTKRAINEYVVSKILDYLDIPHVSCNLREVAGEYECSIPLVTSKHSGFVSFSELYYSIFPIDSPVYSSNIMRVYEFYNLSKQSFNQMVLIDHLIRNSDRRLENWGFLFDTDKSIITSPFPLFDHGFSFFSGKEGMIPQNYSTFKYNTLNSLTMINEAITESLVDLIPGIECLGELIGLGWVESIIPLYSLTDQQINIIRSWLSQIIHNYLHWNMVDPDWTTHKNNCYIELF